MKENTGILMLLVISIVFAFLFFMFRLCEYIVRFNRETKYIVLGMNNAENDGEYRRWRKELHCHYLCLIPFVTKKNAERVYSHMIYRPGHIQKQSGGDGFFHLLAPSVIGICICAVCLCGASWAWFSSATSVGTANIKSAAYSVSVFATQGQTEIQSAEGKGTMTLSLPANGTYDIVIVPGGTAQNGYCKIGFEGREYYTVKLADGDDPINFTVYTGSETGQTLTVTPVWGICTAEGQKIGNGQDDLKILGELSSDNAHNGANNAGQSVEAYLSFEPMGLADTETGEEYTVPHTEADKGDSTSVYEPSEVSDGTPPSDISETKENSAADGSFATD